MNADGFINFMSVTAVTMLKDLRTILPRKESCVQIIFSFSLFVFIATFDLSQERIRFAPVCHDINSCFFLAIPLSVKLIFEIKFITVC